MSTATLPPINSGEVFWGEMAPCEHFVQIYDDGAMFLDALEGFAFGGLHAGDALIVIATAPHCMALDRRLRRRGLDLDALRSCDQYISLNAEETLSKFMVRGPEGQRWPDEPLFEQLVDALITRASRGGRRVRAFGEMVALLWAQNHSGATVRLEHLWHQLCQKKAFSLFCAYPKSGFTQDSAASVRDICAAHSKVLL